MTRSGRAPRLNQHIAEPFVELNPADAVDRGIGPADLVTVAAGDRRVVLRALVTDRVAPGTVFAPMHWTGETASAGRVGALLAAATDPHSGQPALKAGAVELARYAPAWHGFAVSRARPVPDAAYWARARIASRLAGRARRRGRAGRLGSLGPRRLRRVARRDRHLGRPGPRPAAAWR